MNVIKSSRCLLKRSSFLLKKTKDKDFMKINKDFIKVFIHQIGNRLKFSFLSCQMCLCSVKWFFFIDHVFEKNLVGWIGDYWVGGSVSRCSVASWSVDRLLVDLTKFFLIKLQAWRSANSSFYNIFTCGTFIIPFLQLNSHSSKSIHFTHKNNISYFRVKVNKEDTWKAVTLKICRSSELT